MSDQIVTAEELGDLYGTFPGLKEALQESGLDPDQPEIGTAALMTAQVLMNDFERRADRWTARIDGLIPRLAEISEKIKTREAQHVRRMFAYQLVIAAAGFAAATFTLLANSAEFVRGVAIMASWFRRLLTSSLLEPVHAATLGGNDATAPILPVIIYGIYALLAIGYVGSFFAMIFAPDRKVRSDAFEYLKQVTALFIGVASGKLI